MRGLASGCTRTIATSTSSWRLIQHPKSGPACECPTCARPCVPWEDPCTCLKAAWMNKHVGLVQKGSLEVRMLKTCLEVEDLMMFDTVHFCSVGDWKGER